MALTKDQKQKQLKSLKDNISKQKSVIFVDFAKVPSKDLFDLRKNLKEAGCNLKIAKKTLIRIAFGQSNISFWNKIKSSIPGQLALVFGIEDDIAPARIANNFGKTQENLKTWNDRQVYIALGMLLESAALLKIDACPMEGFDGNQFDRILGLDKSEYSSIVIAAVGYRSEKDTYAFAPKVRFEKETLISQL